MFQYLYQKKKLFLYIVMHMLLFYLKFPDQKQESSLTIPIF